MTLGWRCIDCNSDGTFPIPDTGSSFSLQDAYDVIMNQHIANLLKPGEVYVRGISAASHPLSAVIVIAFVAPRGGRLQSRLGKLILITEPGWESPDAPLPDFEVRHVR